VGADPRPAHPQESPLILKRLFRIALASTVARAWAQKSPKWLSIAGTILLFRLWDKHAAKSGRRPAKGKSA
jgi:hypothetical protein